MARTVLQNSQRFTIFMWFFTIVATAFFITIRLIKKQVDVTRPQQIEQQLDNTAAKYQEGGSQLELQEAPFDSKAVDSNNFREEDGCTTRFIKKVCQFQVLFNPLLVGLPLSFISGHTYLMAPIVYSLSVTCCLIFNVFKLHRHCIQHMASRLLLESLWAMVLFLLYINIFVTQPSSMLYLLEQHNQA